MGFTRGGDSRRRDAALEASEEEKLERASSARSHAGRGQSGSTKRFGRATINGKRGDVEHAKFPSENHAAVSAAAAVAVLAGATEGEDGNASPWRPDDVPRRRTLFGIISYRSALSGPGNDGQRFFHLQFIIHTNIGRKEVGSGMAAF